MFGLFQGLAATNTSSNNNLSNSQASAQGESSLPISVPVMDRAFMKVIQNNQKIKNFRFRDYKFQLFDLEPFKKCEKNAKFQQFYDKLVKFNQGIRLGNQKNIANYKKHQFIYSTLNICMNKSEDYMNIHLNQLYKLSHRTKSTNQPKKQQSKFILRPKYVNEEFKKIRQTFQWDSPSQINQYMRKMFVFEQPSQNGKRDLIRSHFSKTYSIKAEKNIKSDLTKTKSISVNKDKKLLQNIFQRGYQNQIVRIKEARQQIEQKKMIQSFKQNHVRVKSQTANNFFNQKRNKRDLLTKPIASNLQIQTQRQKIETVGPSNRASACFSKTIRDKLGKKCNIPIANSSIKQIFLENKKQRENNFSENINLAPIEGLNLLANPLELKKQKVKRFKRKR